MKDVNRQMLIIAWQWWIAWNYCGIRGRAATFDMWLNLAHVYQRYM